MSISRRFWHYREYTGLQKDVAAKTPLDIEVILGVPVKKARELGYIPVLEVIYTLVAAVDYCLREGKIFKWIFWNKSN